MRPRSMVLSGGLRKEYYLENVTPSTNSCGTHVRPLGTAGVGVLFLQGVADAVAGGSGNGSVPE